MVSHFAQIAKVNPFFLNAILEAVNSQAGQDIFTKSFLCFNNRLTSSACNLKFSCIKYSGLISFSFIRLHFSNNLELAYMIEFRLFIGTQFFKRPFLNDLSVVHYIYVIRVLYGREPMRD